MKDILKNKIMEYKTLIIIGVILSLLAHGMILNEFLINEDSLNRLSNESTFGMIRWGRWSSFIMIDYVLKGNYLPFFINSLSIIFLTIGGVLIVDILELKNKMARVFAVSSYSLLPLVSVMFGYAYDILNYSFALLLIVIGVGVIIKATKIRYKLLSCLLIAFSLGIYQSFLSVASAFLFTYYLFQIIRGKNVNLKEILLNTLYLILSLLLYYIILKVLLATTGHTLTSYKGADQLSIPSIITSLPENIINTVVYFKRYLLGQVPVFKSQYGTNLIILTIFLVFIVTFIKNVIKNKINLRNNLIIILVIILYTSALYSITLVTQSYDYSAEYGIVFFNILVVSGCLEMFTGKYVKKILNFAVVILIMLGLLSSNYVHTQQVLLSNMTYNYYLLIYNDVLSNKDYNKDVKVFFYGRVSKNDNFLKSDALIYKYMKEGYRKGPAGLGSKANVKSMFYRDKKAHSLLDYYSFTLKGYDKFDSQIDPSLKDKLFACADKLPSYPKTGSIKKCTNEDVIIVKLGNY